MPWPILLRRGLLAPSLTRRFASSLQLDHDLNGFHAQRNLAFSPPQKRALALTPQLLQGFHGHGEFVAGHWLRGSSPRFLTFEHSQFGRSNTRAKPFSLVQSTKNCGLLPLVKRAEDHGLSPSSSAVPETITDCESSDVSLPTMYHSSSFLDVSSDQKEIQKTDFAFALVVLNHQLPLLTPFLWDKAPCRICADGGANRIYDFIPSLLPNEDPTEVRRRFKPDVIKGDLDSIRPEVREFYARLGTKIFDRSGDQDTTDLLKCLSYVKDKMGDIDRQNGKLLVLGALGGRLDHEFANLNALYLFRKLRIILLSDDSMTFLLPKNYKHEIKINPSFEGPYCGLLPLSGASMCTTTSGLKWNLDKTSLEFGGLLSTSNKPISDRVMVSSDTDLVWTISIQQLQPRLQEIINSRNKVKT